MTPPESLRRIRRRLARSLWNTRVTGARVGGAGRFPARVSACTSFAAGVLAIAAMALLPSCARKADSNAGRGRAEIVPVLAAKVVREDVPVTLKTIGTVEAYRSVAIRARVGGELTHVHFPEGQDVKEGDALFSIDARPYQVALQAAQADLAREKAKAEVAEADARRFADLAQKGYVSKQENDQAAGAADAERAAVQSLEAAVESARLNLEFCSISAPICGPTSNLLVQEGNLVRANDTQALVVINQISPIFVSFSIPERRLPEVLRYMDGSGEGLAVEGTPQGGIGEPARGRLTFVNNAVDRATGTILLTAEFANGDRKLWPGEFVQVSLTLTTRQGVVVTPAAAVQSGQKGDYVLVVKADQTTEMRAVTIGLRQDGNAIIESGLEPGETVITDGHLRVVPGVKVLVKDELGSPAPQGGQGPRNAGGATAK